MVGLTSASGLVGFLSEPDPELRVFALKALDAEVDVLWTDIVDSIPEMYVFDKICMFVICKFVIRAPCVE
jgi:26S proteasome regulatory subunit N2